MQNTHNKIVHKTCAPTGGVCNCDTNDDTRFLQDGGNITDPAALPVSQVLIGDTGGVNEEGFYTLGPLECYSSTSSPCNRSSYWCAQSRTIYFLAHSLPGNL